MSWEGDNSWNWTDDPEKEAQTPTDDQARRSTTTDPHSGEPEQSTAVDSDEALSFPAVHVSELLGRQFPPRRMLLQPWLSEYSTSMVYGPRGVGKSLLSLSIAVAVAGQREFLGWRSTGRHGVLYVDGEMAGQELQERVKTLADGDTSTLPLRFLARDLCEHGMPPLNSAKLRRVIEAIAAEHAAKLIIIDNLSTLWRGDENEAKSWDQMQDWLFRLRHRHSVLIVHHAGKSGSQRGTSRKEDALDVVIALRRPCTDGKVSGATFNVGFDKTRALTTEAHRTFHAHLRATGARGLEAWQRTGEKVDTQLEGAVAMHREGRSQGEIATALGVHPSTVSRWLKDAHDKGLIPEDDGDAAPEEVNDN